MTELDVAALRSHFPSLAGGAAHFDAPGGTQTPTPVAEAIGRTMLQPMSVRGSLTQAERNAEETVLAARAAIGDLLGVAGERVVHGRSSTSLIFDMARVLSTAWEPGDEIVLTRLEHDSNVRPWVYAAERAGVTVRWADFDVETGELDPEALAALLGERTRLVAITGASNVIGTVPDLAAVTAHAHAAGALVFVDGVQLSAHDAVDVDALGVDLYVVSAYKFFGPHCGYLAGRPELLESLRPEKLLPSMDRVPERFELGTLPYELLAGTTAAVDFIADMVPGEGTRRERIERSLAAAGRHEDRLARLIEDEVAALPGATLWSRAAHRTPTIYATFEGHDVADLSRHLAARDVNAPAGGFYAHETVQHLGLAPTGALRLGLAAYSDESDVDRLVEGLKAWFAG
ncbi:cysteine desulfurase-like protein [Alteromonas gracilis]